MSHTSTCLHIPRSYMKIIHNLGLSAFMLKLKTCQDNCFFQPFSFPLKLYGRCFYEVVVICRQLTGGLIYTDVLVCSYNKSIHETNYSSPCIIGFVRKIYTEKV